MYWLHSLILHHTLFMTIICGPVRVIPDVLSEIGRLLKHPILIFFSNWPSLFSQYWFQQSRRNCTKLTVIVDLGYMYGLKIWKTRGIKAEISKVIFNFIFSFDWYYTHNNAKPSCIIVDIAVYTGVTKYD